MKNRSRLDIVAAILDIAATREGAGKTLIMYKAFLSYPQLNEYLEILLSRHLLKYLPNAKKYCTTEEGKRFLIGYEQIGCLLMPKSSKIARPIPNIFSNG